MATSRAAPSDASAVTSGITVRETNSGDLEEILRHRKFMFLDMGHPETIVDEIVRSCRPQIKQYLAEGTYRGWFAVAPDGRVASGVGLLITPLVSGPLAPENIHRAYLLNVYTYPEFRKRGLARQLTQKAIDYCREEGFKVLWLHASKYGRSVYESMGFEATNEMRLILE